MLGPAQWRIGALLLFALSCARETEFAAWPALDTKVPVFVLTIEGSSVDEILGPFDPNALDVLPELELADDGELWIVQADPSVLEMRHALLASRTFSDLGLVESPSSMCTAVRYETQEARLLLPLDAEARWFESSEGAGFSPASTPPFAALLSWALPASEGNCPLEAPVLRPFGAEARMFAPGVVPPPGLVAEDWTEMKAASRINDDRVLAASLNAAYIFERGEQRSDFEGPKVLAAQQLVPNLRAGIAVYFNDALFLPEPRPRALLSVYESAPSGASVYGWLFEVELSEQGFGAMALISQGPDLGVLLALDRSSYLAAGGSTWLIREGDSPPTLRSVEANIGFQRAELSENGERIALGGGRRLLVYGDSSRPARAAPHRRTHRDRERRGGRNERHHRARERPELERDAPLLGEHLQHGLARAA